MALLVEVFHVQPGLDEAQGGARITPIGNTGRYRVRCKMQHCGKRNRNNRRYASEKTWSKHTLAESPFMKTVRARRVVGQLEHPKDGISSFPLGAIVVTNLEPPNDLGEVYGEFETLSTPHGQIASAYIRDGVGFGISSRGDGTLVLGPDGIYDVQEDFEPKSFDLVLDESTPGAEIAAMKLKEARTALVEAAGGDISKAAVLAEQQTSQALQSDTSIATPASTPVNIQEMQDVIAAHSGLPTPPVGMTPGANVEDAEKPANASPAMPSGHHEFLMSMPDGTGHYRAYDNTLNQWDVWFFPHNGKPDKIAAALQTMRDAKVAAENHYRMSVLASGGVHEDAHISAEPGALSTLIDIQFDHTSETRSAFDALSEHFDCWNDSATSISVMTENTDLLETIQTIRSLIEGHGLVLRESQIRASLVQDNEFVWKDQSTMAADSNPVSENSSAEEQLGIAMPSQNFVKGRAKGSAEYDPASTDADVDFDAKAPQRSDPNRNIFHADTHHAADHGMEAANCEDIPMHSPSSDVGCYEEAEALADMEAAHCAYMEAKKRLERSGMSEAANLFNTPLDDPEDIDLNLNKEKAPPENTYAEAEAGKPASNKPPYPPGTAPEYMEGETLLPKPVEKKEEEEDKDSKKVDPVAKKDESKKAAAKSEAKTAESVNKVSFKIAPRSAGGCFKLWFNESKKIVEVETHLPNGQVIVEKKNGEKVEEQAAVAAHPLPSGHTNAGADTAPAGRIAIGSVVHFTGKSRRYLVIAISPKPGSGSIVLAALGGNFRGSSARAEENQLQLASDQRLLFDGYLAGYLKTEAEKRMQLYGSKLPAGKKLEVEDAPLPPEDTMNEARKADSDKRKMRFLQMEVARLEKDNEQMTQLVEAMVATQKAMLVEARVNEVIAKKPEFASVKTKLLKCESVEKVAEEVETLTVLLEAKQRELSERARAPLTENSKLQTPVKVAAPTPAVTGLASTQTINMSSARAENVPSAKTVQESAAPVPMLDTKPQSGAPAVDDTMSRLAAYRRRRGQ